tara:strand:- start:898 stop:1236 length:339 start_codon:yes stop_codon:yes gene_type:complete
MSKSSLQRADGCSVFFSLLVATVLVFAFFILRQCVSDEEISPVDSRTANERKHKVAEHLSEEGNYTERIDKAHIEANSSLESVMQKIVNEYSSHEALKSVEANKTGVEGNGK